MSRTMTSAPIPMPAEEASTMSHAADGAKRTHASLNTEWLTTRMAGGSVSRLQAANHPGESPGSLQSSPLPRRGASPEELAVPVARVGAEQTTLSPPLL